VDWTKEIGGRAGLDGGWRSDFPLDHDLPDELAVDCSHLRLPIHPMLAVRLRVFADWHRKQGRKVILEPPSDQRARNAFSAMAIDLDHPESPPESDAILPVTYLADPNTVEDVAERTREILEYHLPDVSPLGHAAFMAVSELCGNAIEHGQNPFGAYAAVSRIPSLGARCQSPYAISESASRSTFASNSPSGEMMDTR
jgi:hypothetical protein